MQNKYKVTFTKTLRKLRTPVLNASAMALAAARAREKLALDNLANSPGIEIPSALAQMVQIFTVQDGEHER
jgi:hypothetical protein